MHVYSFMFMRVYMHACMYFFVNVWKRAQANKVYVFLFLNPTLQDVDPQILTTLMVKYLTIIVVKYVVVLFGICAKMFIFIKM
jgi:hypothetical protein